MLVGAAAVALVVVLYYVLYRLGSLLGLPAKQQDEASSDRLAFCAAIVLISFIFVTAVSFSSICEEL